MLAGMECLLSFRNPSSVNYASSPLFGAPSLLSQSLRLARTKIGPCGISPRELTAKITSSDFLYSPLYNKSSRCLTALAVSQEEPYPEKEKDVKSKESEEAWKQAMESFNEQATKMRSVSQEAYEEYSERAAVILQKASEQLKVQAEKTKSDFSVFAQEISSEGKQYLSFAAENSPVDVKDIVETYSSSTDEVKQVSHLRDFHVGIPYGFLLSLGGFISFMLTGSIAAIRFGIILGGTLLALSIWSMKIYQRGNASPIASTGQTVIAAIIFLREIRLLFQGAPFISYITTAISGVAVVFFMYKLMTESWHSGNPGIETKSQN